MNPRIRLNLWGNWNGCRGKRKVIEFGTDGNQAARWLMNENGERHPFTDEDELARWKRAEYN